MLFNEPKLLKYIDQISVYAALVGFSALQRAEIAEIKMGAQARALVASVSVLFNEPKLLKLDVSVVGIRRVDGFSALQRAEIAEMAAPPPSGSHTRSFQCSSTSRNC